MQLPNLSAVNKVIASDKVVQRIKAKGITINNNKLVGVRLALNVLKSTGELVHTVHDAKTPKSIAGSVIDYRAFCVVTNATFPVNQKQRESIASGGNKSPMAQVNGLITNKEPIFDKDMVEVSFNPKRVHLFVDAEGYAVKSAAYAVCLGHRVYCKGVTYYKENEVIRAGDSPSQVKFK